MQYTLRQAVFEILGEDKGYLNYYRRMVKDYENVNWFFNIKTLVKQGIAEISCPYTFSSRGYRRQICLCVTDFEEFKGQFEEYLKGWIYPLKYARAHKHTLRKAWLDEKGFISLGTQHCEEAQYNCSECIEKPACDIAKEHTKNCPEMMIATKMLKILYVNLRKGHFAKMAREKNKEA